MKKGISLNSALPLIEEMLSADGEVSFSPSGFSMMPLLRHRKDTIVLKKPVGRLKKYDVPLYRRKDGAFVLHRVVGMNADGYIMCGDNQTVKEYAIKDDQIIAVMTSFCRGGRHIDCASPTYMIYSRFWTFIFPLRKFYRRVRSALGKIRRKLFEKN